VYTFVLNQAILTCLNRVVYEGLKNAFRVAVNKARQEHAAQLETASFASQLEAPGAFDDANSTASSTSSEKYKESPAVEELPEEMSGKLCMDFQDIAFMHVEDRLRHALTYVDRCNIPVTSIVVVGGVAANKELRR
jgi:tRNA A37 threonylcarbamoyltransferase TsaD